MTATVEGAPVLNLSAPGGSEPVSPINGRSLRVAIVDDDPSVRTAIGRLISASGMVGGCFANCMELSSRAALFDPDCIIVDLYMPGLDGLEAMNYLRKTGARAPIILVTAQDDPALGELCLKAGANAFLRKPLQASELLATINQLAADR